MSFSPTTRLAATDATGEPTPAQLARYFFLDDADRELLADRRGDHNRLGMALQIVTARFLGTFLADPTDVPAAVIASVTAQLGIPGNMDLTSYRDGEARWDHAIDIRKRYEYRDFSEQPGTSHWCVGCIPVPG